MMNTTIKTTKITSLSKAVLIIAAAFLILSLFVPIWSISLDAPQYPEGLSLQIWAHKIAGDVDIINGLNHYIGMKTLHTDDFIEFKILPYIISIYALLFVVAAKFGSKKMLIFTLCAFILFGVVAMVDFWKWEYDYGHHLDPNAAIKVPGMAYQPPLIGFKQLLNFGAYSMPSIGGWLFIAAGLLLCITVFIENRKSKQTKIRFFVIAIALTLALSSCTNTKPEPILYNKDACHFCKMSISDDRFGTELITTKGRIYKFDDLSCMLLYKNSIDSKTIENCLVTDFNEKKLIDAFTSTFIIDESLKSPMGGNIAAFKTKDAAINFALDKQIKSLNWTTLISTHNKKNNLKL